MRIPDTEPPVLFKANRNEIEACRERGFVVITLAAPLVQRTGQLLSIRGYRASEYTPCYNATSAIWSKEISGTHVNAFAAMVQLAQETASGAKPPEQPLATDVIRRWYRTSQLVTPSDVIMNPARA